MSDIAFIDAPAGIAGDMCLGALVDAGWPLERLELVVRALGLDRVTVTARRVQRGALAATKVDVLYDGNPADGAPGEPGREHQHDHGRTLTQICEALEKAREVPESARVRAVRVFEALAWAEGRVHGVEARAVHFHEVGAADALVDVLGTCTALADLGVGEVRVGPLPMGEGRVATAHGTLPLPAPAVLHLLEGHPLSPSDERYEQVTPTGAALVRVLSTGSRIPDGFCIRTVGHGAGTYEGGRLPNLVRLLVGGGVEAATPSDAVLLETNLDDATGQEIASVIELALGEGALDAWAVPATMKKGRPGVVLSVLAAPADAAGLEALLFAETPTLGIRRRPVRRSVLPRRHVSVETPWGPVRLKVRETPRGAEATPEYEDAKALALRHGVPLRRVLETARAAWRAD